jgi:4'-phosphopantetheinyl transferase
MVPPVSVHVYRAPVERTKAMMADVVARELEIAPAELEISRECKRCGDAKHGKPFVAGAEALSFSVSHSGDSALIAVAQDATVGIDIEAIRPRPNLAKLAARVLDPVAHAAFSTAPDDEQLVVFLRAWTEKEAYLKAIGLGIATDLRAVEIPDAWTVEPLDALPTYVATLAVDRPAEIGLTDWQ